MREQLRTQFEGSFAGLKLPVPRPGTPERAEAAARAVKTGCVLGSDLALGRANADDTQVGDVKGDPKSPAPFLSVNGDEPPRAVAQSLARTRLVPMKGQPNRFGALAETRQTIAPVTIFKGSSWPSSTPSWSLLRLWGRHSTLRRAKSSKEP